MYPQVTAAVVSRRWWWSSSSMVRDKPVLLFLLYALTMTTTTTTILVCALNDEIVYEECRVCTESASMLTKPDVVLVEQFANVLDEDRTCAEVDELGIAGAFNPFGCILLHAAGIESLCGCTNVTSEVPMPSLAPTINTAPVVPTPPTTTLAGNVVIRMTPLNSGIEEDTEVQDGYEISCGLFFSLYMEKELGDISCAYSKVNTQREMLRRHLQNKASLDVLTEVTAVQNLSTSDSIAFQESLVTVLNQNRAGFVNTLRTSGNIASQEYFSFVETAEAIDPNGESPSVPESGDSGLSGGAKFGIAAAVIVVVAVAAFVFIRSEQQKRKETEGGQARDLSLIEPNTNSFFGDAAISGTQQGTRVDAATKTKTLRVIAPAGKLGIVLDTSQEGPMVSTVKPGSAMEGKLFSGDLISMINGEVTHAMSAASINAIMVKTADAEREFMVVRPISTKDNVSDTLGNDKINTKAVTSSGHVKEEKIKNDVPPTAAVVATQNQSKSDLDEVVITAPAGKLGIVIDTTLDGPKIHSVRAEGPMAGKLFPGDLIVKIAGESTVAMNSTAINALMVKTSGGERVITLLRKKNKDAQDPEDDEVMM